MTSVEQLLVFAINLNDVVKKKHIYYTFLLIMYQSIDVRMPKIWLQNNDLWAWTSAGTTICHSKKQLCSFLQKKPFMSCFSPYSTFWMCNIFYIYFNKCMRFSRFGFIELPSARIENMYLSLFRVMHNCLNLAIPSRKWGTL